VIVVGDHAAGLEVEVVVAVDRLARLLAADQQVRAACVERLMGTIDVKMCAAHADADLLILPPPPVRDAVCISVSVA